MENYCIIRDNLYNLSTFHPYLEAIDSKANLLVFLCPRSDLHPVIVDSDKTKYKKMLKKAQQD